MIKLSYLKYPVIILILIFISVISKGQDFESMKDQLELQKGEEKVDLYYEIAKQHYLQSDYENSFNYAFEGLEFAKKINYKRGEGILLNLSGAIYRDQYILDSAMFYFSESLKIREEINDKK